MVAMVSMLMVTMLVMKIVILSMAVAVAKNTRCHAMFSAPEKPKSESQGLQPLPV